MSQAPGHAPFQRPEPPQGTPRTDATAELREQLVEAKARAERAEAAASGERDRAEALRERLSDAEARAIQASAEALGALQQAEALTRAEQTRKANYGAPAPRVGRLAGAVRAAGRRE